MQTAPPDPLEGVVVRRLGEIDRHLDHGCERRALGFEHGREVGEREPDLGLGVTDLGDGAVRPERSLARGEHQRALGDDRLRVLVVGGPGERIGTGAVHGR